jgi:hypothetical protein
MSVRAAPRVSPDSCCFERTPTGRCRNIDATLQNFDVCVNVKIIPSQKFHPRFWRPGTARGRARSSQWRSKWLKSRAD